MSVSSQILTQLQGYRPEMLGFLEELVAIESPSRNPATQSPAFGKFGDALRDLDFSVRRIPGQTSGGLLYARPESRSTGTPMQLLLGHIDTVWPVGTLTDMPIETEKGRMKGPGVYDMKGGLTQILYALKTLRHLNLETAVTPVILVNSDEEIGSQESTRNIRRLARVANRAFVLEPSLGIDGRIKTARKGIGRFTIKVKGKAAHAGLNPEAGASAILELSHQIQSLFALNDPAAGVTVNVGMVDGGLGANVVAPESSAMVDVRVPTHEDARLVESQIKGLKPATPGVQVSVEGGFRRPPMERTEPGRALWTMAQELGQELGMELQEGAAGGGSDGNTTSQFTATLDGLGPVGDGAHAHHEFLFVDSLIERAALLTLLILAPPLQTGNNED
ncbi:MAG: M20 family metallopeptidase [Gammaproteobacteria bacterium]|nr:M20 family metallopeptidase [Gammaproteobacteria bacterium]